MKALTRRPTRADAPPTIYQVADRAEVFHRHRVPRAARDRAGRRDHPGQGARRGGGAALHAVPAGPLARRGPARRQRHRVPRPVRSLLRRGRARLRGGRRRAGPQRADPVHPRASGRPRDGARPGGARRRPGGAGQHRRRRGPRGHSRARTSRSSCSRATTSRASTRSPPRTSPARARSSVTSSPTTAIATSRSSATPTRRRTPRSAGTGFGTGCAITASATTVSCPARSTRQAAGGRPTRCCSKATRPRGLVCANDEIALGAITTAAEELGLRRARATSPSPAGTT